MDKEQAKGILLLYRPGSSDGDDPEMAEALRFAKQAPELARWLEEHCALQEVIRTKFRRTPVPEGLLEQIVSERKAALSRNYRRKAVALAATVALMVGLFGIARYYWPEPRLAEDKSFPAFRGQLAGLVLRQYPRMDLLTNNLAQIRQFLAQNHALTNYSLPKSLEAATPTGCATNVLGSSGRQVAMICFNSGKTSPPTQPDLFLFITDRTVVAGAPPTNGPHFARVSRLTTASWTEGDKTYVLGGLGDEEFLRKFL